MRCDHGAQQEQNEQNHPKKNGDEQEVVTRKISICVCVCVFDDRRDTGKKQREKYLRCSCSKKGKNRHETRKTVSSFFRQD
jgi:hypothetical protein